MLSEKLRSDPPEIPFQKVRLGDRSTLTEPVVEVLGSFIDEAENFSDQQSRKLSGLIPDRLLAVAADGFHRATFHGFLGLSFFFGSRGLFVNVGIATVIAACKIGRGGFAAKIAIDALI